MWSPENMDRELKFNSKQHHGPLENLNQESYMIQNFKKFL
jgi:hypothetical protein